jgi:hypothetical protein
VWNKTTSHGAAQSQNLEMLQWVLENGCPRWGMLFRDKGASGEKLIKNNNPSTLPSLSPTPSTLLTLHITNTINTNTKNNNTTQTSNNTTTNAALVATISCWCCYRC